MDKIMDLPFIKGLDLCEQFFQEAIKQFPKFAPLFAAGDVRVGNNLNLAMRSF